MYDIEMIDLGDVMQETKGVFNPTSIECSTQDVDSRDEDA